MPYYGALRGKDFGKRAVGKITALRAQLKKEIPSKTANNTLLLATWNIRDFDSNKFGHGPRLPESFYYIAEVISAFDLVAIQEVNEDLGPLDAVMRLLGPSWDYIVTDVTEGTGGNGERLAYVYDKRKVWFRNIAGEIVLPLSGSIAGDPATIKLPKDHKITITGNASLILPDGSVKAVSSGDSFALPIGAHEVDLPEGQNIANPKQFSRTPFLVAFQAGWFKFNICTVHIYYGSKSGLKKNRRVKEIGAVAKFFKDRRTDELKRGIDNTCILLGDFNIVNGTDDTMKALKRHEFVLPENLFKSNVKEDAFYDQIAFLTKNSEIRLGDSMPNNGVFRFFESVYTNSDQDHAAYKAAVQQQIANEEAAAEPPAALTGDQKKGLADRKKFTKNYYTDKWRTWQLSDHYPLWVELKIDFTEEYLKKLDGELP